MRCQRIKSAFLNRWKSLSSKCSIHKTAWPSKHIKCSWSQYRVRFAATNSFLGWSTGWRSMRSVRNIFPLEESDFLAKSKQKYKEAKKVASIMCKYGYFFHVASNHTGCLREYKEFFRFQAPYFWVSTSWNASDVDYGRFLFFSHFFERRLLDPCLLSHLSGEKETSLK